VQKTNMDIFTVKMSNIIIPLLETEASQPVPLLFR
jgi:hypothetical protein